MRDTISSPVQTPGSRPIEVGQAGKWTIGGRPPLIFGVISGFVLIGLSLLLFLSNSEGLVPVAWFLLASGILIAGVCGILRYLGWPETKYLLKTEPGRRKIRAAKRFLRKYEMFLPMLFSPVLEDDGRLVRPSLRHFRGGPGLFVELVLPRSAKAAQPSYWSHFLEQGSQILDVFEIEYVGAESRGSDMILTARVLTTDQSLEDRSVQL